MQKQDQKKIEDAVCDTMGKMGTVNGELPITSFIQVSSMLTDLYNKAFEAGYRACEGSNIIKNKN